MKIESIAKLLCPRKSKVLGQVKRASKLARFTSTNPTPGLGKESELKWPQKGIITKQMSFATGSILTLSFDRSIGKEVALIGLASVLIALMGEWSIPLPFTPVPISFRFQTILALSVLLGSKRAFLATSLFLIQGMMGFPLFANGASGLAGLMGPTGGYLVAYPIAAFLVGFMSERSSLPFFLKNGLGFAIGTSLVYALGMAYLATFVGLKQAFLLGVSPFILLDLLKSVITLRLLGWMKRRPS